MALLNDALTYIKTIRIDGIEHPEYLYALIPAFIIILLLLRRNFVNIKEDEQVQRKRKRFQWFILFTRILIAALLVTALAVPYAMQEKFIEGDPVIHVVVDKTRSMDLYENTIDNLVTALKDRVEVEVTTLETTDCSPVGDALLGQIRPFESVLLFSDGNANDGAALGDVGVDA